MKSNRIGALDIAELISAQIGSFVYAEAIQFLAVEGDSIRCWHMNSGGEGPTFDIELHRQDGEWSIHLTELPPGTEQEIEVPL